jgi:hypothetical protein
VLETLEKLEKDTGKLSKSEKLETTENIQEVFPEPQKSIPPTSNPHCKPIIPSRLTTVAISYFQNLCLQLTALFFFTSLDENFIIREKCQQHKT